MLLLRLGFQLVKNSVQIFEIEDEAGALRHADESRSPDVIECPSLDADVGNGLLVGETALHPVADGCAHVDGVFRVHEEVATRFPKSSMTASR